VGQRAGDDVVAGLEPLSCSAEQLACDPRCLTWIDSLLAGVRHLAVDHDAGANELRRRLWPQRAEREGAMPDIAGDDALEVVGRPSDVDELERRAEPCRLAVVADLDRQLGVGPKLVRALRREDGAGLEPRRRRQVAEDGLEVLFALDDAAADLPTDTLGPRRQLGAPLQQLDPQRKCGTLVERYETGTSASFSNCRSDCALVAA
jgi:hypothetical protein